jgi:glycosyltransferase involved in cell wall biosynthesis
MIRPPSLSSLRNGVKVCFITLHPPFDQRIFHKECKTLYQAGYNVSLIVPLDEEKTIDGIKLIALPQYHSRLAKFLLLPFMSFFIGIKHSAQVYHLHDPPLIIPGLLLKLFGKKIIYDVHEDFPKRLLIRQWIPSRLRPFAARMARLGEQFSSIFFDAIITASYIPEHLKRHKRVCTIQNYPLLSYFNFKEKELENIPKEENVSIFRVIYAGGLSPDRGIHKMVEAMEYLKEAQVELILCGRFSSAAYEREVRSLNGFQRVKFLGWLNHKEIPSVLSRANAALHIPLFPMQESGELPVKIFEYMAAGLPIISSNFPLLKNIIEEHNCGICVDPTNSKEIAEAIKYLFHNPEKAQKMGENGREVVIKKYNWEQESKKLLKLYEELLSQNA